jgi:NAD(P)-dependent dehydrogenase (short-subunit alcohol dehydrogenase family)
MSEPRRRKLLVSKLAGRTALITGGSRSIGAAIARAFAAPGPTDTDILLGMSPEWRARKMAELPIGRFARPAEIAPTAVLLASDDGAFYVGQTLSPNGGDVML